MRLKGSLSPFTGGYHYLLLKNISDIASGERPNDETTCFKSHCAYNRMIESLHHNRCRSRHRKGGTQN